MSSGELVLVHSDSDVRAYYKEEHGKSAIILYSDGRHSLTDALGAVKETARLAGRSTGNVRFRPVQRNEPAHIVVEYAGALTDDQSLDFAVAFVNAVKFRG